MHTSYSTFWTAACLFQNSLGSPTGLQSGLQAPLEDLNAGTTQQTPARQLHGKFLHITDLHPDSFYKIHSSTEEEDACHRGKGLAGTYGAETSDCDTPHALVNATFKWIKENLRDQVDFVVWTGDSARHDSDEEIPRTQQEVLNSNRWIAEQFVQTFNDDDEPGQPQSIPIVATFGNNDILPHNILLSGPNKWLKTYTDVWSKFIPEEQRHGFERGGWYYVEVIPKKLAVFSLNTLYFFDHNAGVDGCALRSEPGYEHFEWLRIQLQFMRERGMKAILMGHVPPARTDSKQLWDETCWQKYTLWLQQYRDVVLGGLYGHMNIDHFMIQDTKKIDILSEETSQGQKFRAFLGDELSIESANDYLEELRADWSDLPNPKVAMHASDVEEMFKKKKGKKDKKSKKDKALEKMGGPWGERFQVSMVSPSVVPNYFPTLRVIEYNITGLDVTQTWAGVQSTKSKSVEKIDWMEETPQFHDSTFDEFSSENEAEFKLLMKKKKKKGKKDKNKKPHNPDLTVPSPPSKDTPPGPAYSPQSLTLLSYTQYFANLTHINNDHPIDPSDDSEDGVGADKWHEGKHKGKHPKDKVPEPNEFRFEVEYDTKSDKVYKMKDLTVRSWVRLAHRIGQYGVVKPDDVHLLDQASDSEHSHFSSQSQTHSLDRKQDQDQDPEHVDVDDHENDVDGNEAEAQGKKKHKKHKKKKHHRKHNKNKVWLAFIQRAFVGTMEDEELESFHTHQDVDWEGEVRGEVMRCCVGEG